MYRFNPVGTFCMLALSFAMMFPVSGSCAVTSPTLMGAPEPFRVLIPVLRPGNHWVSGRVEFDFNKTELGDVAKPGMGVVGDDNKEDRSKVFAAIPPEPRNSQQLAEHLAEQLNRRFVPEALRASAAEVPGSGGDWQLTFGMNALQVTTAHIEGMFNPGIHGPDKYGSYTNWVFYPPAMPQDVTLNQFPNDQVPEPTSIAIVGVLGLTLATVRRRKRQNRTSHITTVT